MTQRLFILLFVLIVLLGATAYASQDQLLQYLPGVAPTPPPNPFPSPLQAPLEKEPANLTTAGILTAINKQRTQANLPTLNLHPELTQTAHFLLDNMLASQSLDYPAIANYGTGANVISGNFLSEADLVQNLMDNHAHRANILSPDYSLIGLATKPGTINDQQTWLAIQIFALPASPVVN